jgi:hypothetical protein
MSRAQQDCQLSGCWAASQAVLGIFLKKFCIHALATPLYIGKVRSAQELCRCWENVKPLWTVSGAGAASSTESEEESGKFLAVRRLCGSSAAPKGGWAT